MNKYYWATIWISLIGIGLLFVVKSQSVETVDPPNVTKAIEEPKTPGNPTVSKRKVPEDYVKIGGVFRPQKDVEKRPEANQESALKFEIGKSEPVSALANENTKSVFASAFSRKENRRLSPLFKSKEFDSKEFLSDPDNYLKVVDAGRVWQVLEPGEDTPHIARKSQYYSKLLQGESAVLKAVTEPNMPVTFYSPRLGKFQNELSVVTVQADEQGIATANYRSTPGTVGEIDILAGSPVRAGHAKFLVNVVVPQ